ncbi:MAG TPA: pseudouridine synthase [Ideonella sp.]|nr:pseudouridine synthase [Ideonella sp.]
MVPLHADAHLIVIDKPAGLLSVPGKGADKADCAAARVQALYPDALVVHRLDQATSGLLVFARGIEAQRRLSRAFETREVHKGYVAVVAGLPADDEGLIALPLSADWPRRPLQRVDFETGKPAQTHWRVLARDEASLTCRLALTPLTGRTHQLRLHLQAMGHAILGDALYAPPDLQARAPRLLLHAQTLRLPHPLDGAPFEIEAAAPF